MGNEIFTLEFLNFQRLMMMLTFYLSFSFLRFKKYLFFEVRLDWYPTSKMEKIQHVIFSLSHSRLSWVQLKFKMINSDKSFWNQNLIPTIVKYVNKTSVIMKNMLNIRFIRIRWIKTNLVDISKDLSKIFKHSKKRA